MRAHSERCSSRCKHHLFRSTSYLYQPSLSAKREHRPLRAVRKLVHLLYASHLRWKPVGAQAALPDYLAEAPSVAKPDIILVKLRRGQELNIEMHCVKSCGRDHAKYSPVATATSRLLPYVRIFKSIPEQLQAKFTQSFSPGVIGSRRNKQWEWEVFVKDARKDTMSRNVFLYPEFEGAVKLTRVRDRFLFTVESAGQMAPNAILPEAIAVFTRKLRTVSKALDELMHEDVEPEVQEGGWSLALSVGRDGCTNTILCY
ncbi:hypothetical protein DACRYDRAFT_59476 [Dacryopinax primogenitus]|uniref:DNA-directed RNA polymerase RpoA/D/Rpb3-type domain-containing protein n=1 Tax=Dacryopinax primogenitus (strain DJM 731) TaxID=1858805 RepID=M5FPN4_DACPD|nr:uncharacterized protein DACRYDRAFT_59476 [Dacryopinax primogenitus]EJT97183.1 hypothetical protein DACRYDRAFT_59476 [Dacryopinax primogenitus]